MKHIEWNQPHTHFGALLRVQRDQWGVKQREVLAALPGWTQANYSRIEGGTVAPAFEHLLPLYTALSYAGVHWTAVTREQFLILARLRIAEKKTHWEHHSEEEWTTLQTQLAGVDHFPDEESGEPSDASSALPSQPLLAETRHLLGREEWLSWIIHLVQSTKPKKLLVLQGTIGIGKSSEMHRLARHFLQGRNHDTQVIWVPMLSAEHMGEPEAALSVLLGTILTETGSPPAPSNASLSVHIGLALSSLERQTVPTLLFLDNAESLLNEDGVLAPCWEHFLTRFSQSQHRGTLILATKEWPGWSGRESIFVAETTVPPLSREVSVQLLERLGLEGVPGEHLQAVSERVGGIPLCLEWVAALVHDPLLLDDWHSFGGEIGQHPLTERLLHLLAEPSLLRGHLAMKLKPLLQRILEKRLSAEATEVLKALAVSPIPLAKPALEMLCPRPGLLKELRDVSLLVAYPNRIQSLPMVASVVLQLLSPEETHQREERLMEALKSWLDDGRMSLQEAGAIVTELATLLLNHHRLLDAAQLLIQYGWMSFNQGNAPHLARLAEKVMQGFDWHETAEHECGGLLLYYLLSPYIGKPIDFKKLFSDSLSIYQAILEEKVRVYPLTEGHVTNNLMLYYMNELSFEKAQSLLEASHSRLEPFQKDDIDLQVSLLEKHAWFFGRWCEYLQEQGNTQKSREFRDQAIAFYRQCSTLLSIHQDSNNIKKRLLKRRLARALNNLSYHLSRINELEEALQAVESAITLREQGYAEVVGLAVSYGQKSEILIELARFQEALLFNEKALQEILKWADTGHTLSQEEVWVYRVNRGRLYLRLGRIEEAEQWLQDALPHIHPTRRTYRMFAEDALEEIKQWRQQAPSSHYQLDWRWIERYRKLDAFDAYWWLAQAGPFTAEEQQEWNQIYTPHPDESVREHLATLITQSRERELAAALTEKREPCLWYPTIDIEDVQGRIALLLQLDMDIAQEEPNALVRQLYHQKIEEIVAFLRMIEATYEKNSEHFRLYSCFVYPAPTPEEINYVLSQVWSLIHQGLQNPDTVEISQNLLQYMSEQLCLSPDFSIMPLSERQPIIQYASMSSTDMQKVTAQAAKRFFEVALRESWYEGWQVVIDKASTTRVESGLRQFILANSQITVERVRYYLIHELGSHVARAVAGERSPLGLLGIGTRNYAPTEEGLALYYERELAKLQGRTNSEWGTLLGTLSTGLASGIVTPPQTFLSLCIFLESFFLLRRMLNHQDNDIKTAQNQARKTALANCLRTFRGVPDLEQKGICFTKDAMYLRGLWMIEHAVRADTAVLDRLAAGKVALEYLPVLEELGIHTTPQPLAKLAYSPDLYDHILSFETSQQPEQPV